MISELEKAIYDGLCAYCKRGNEALLLKTKHGAPAGYVHLLNSQSVIACGAADARLAADEYRRLKAIVDEQRRMKRAQAEGA